MKWYYNKYYIPLLFNPGDYVMFKFYHGYRISGVKNRKLELQRVGRFPIKRRVSSLFYELEFSANMKIHPIVLVINLEFFLSKADPYDRPYNDYPSTVKEVNID